MTGLRCTRHAVVKALPASLDAHPLLWAPGQSMAARELALLRNSAAQRSLARPDGPEFPAVRGGRAGPVRASHVNCWARPDALWWATPQCRFLVAQLHRRDGRGSPLDFAGNVYITEETFPQR
jgi:hypothetical protein